MDAQVVQATLVKKIFRRQSIIAEKLANDEMSQKVARKLAEKIGDRDGMATIGVMFQAFDLGKDLCLCHSSLA
jgi:hypothetical protein